MRRFAFIVFIASATACHGAEVSGSLDVKNIKLETVRLELALTNHSNRDYCFFQSLSAPALLDEHGKTLPIHAAQLGDGPIFSNEDGSYAIWTRPNNEQVVWRQSDDEFLYTITFDRPVNPDLALSATLDIFLFDCVDLHSRPLKYPVNDDVKHLTLHFATPANPASSTPAPSRP